MDTTPFKCNRCSAFIGETNGFELKAGGLRFKRTITANCVACGRTVKWTKHVGQLPLTNVVPETPDPSQVSILTTIQQSLASADYDRQVVTAGARPLKRDREIDSAEAEQDDKYFDALARRESDRAKRKLG